MKKPNKNLNKSLDKILKETDGYYYIYVPAVAVALGMTAAVMLCYLVHWEGKCWKKDNWIWKSMEEMRTGTGLTRDQQDSAIKVLKKLGFIRVERRSTHGVRHYQVDMEKVEAHLGRLWKTSKHYKPPKPKTSKRDSRKTEMTFAENQQSYTEETHNDTSRIDPNFEINPSSPGGQVASQQVRPDDSPIKPKILEGEVVDTSFMDLFMNNTQGSSIDDDEILEV